MGIRLAIAAGALVFVVGVITAHNNNIRREAVITERASVEKQATKKDARAQSNRRSVADSDPISVLAKRGELRD